MRPVSLDEIATLRYAKQHFCDCYLVAGLDALSQTRNGTRILQQNIQREGNNFHVRFNDVYGKVEEYFVSGKECGELILTDKYLEPIPIDIPHNPIIKAVEIAMSKLIRKHPFKKPFLSRLIECRENFEYNKPSNFLEMFTGVKPIIINESGLRMNLNKKSQEAMDLFEKMADEKEVSFVAGTSGMHNKNLLSWHCFVVNNSDIENRKLTLTNHRTPQIFSETYSSVVQKFKYLCGYFNETLRDV